MTMNNIMISGIPFSKYLAEKGKEKENIAVVVNCEPIEKDGFKRLRKTIHNLNENISKCGLEVLDSEGNWKELMSAEELEAIKLELPAGLSEIEKLKRAECFASEAKERLGGMAYDLCHTTAHWLI